MPSIENHILRIINEARTPLDPTEVANRLNHELGGQAYTASEIESLMRKMSNLKAVGKAYKPTREDSSQAAFRVVREATKDK